jgi:hypothetical protein
VVGISDVCDVAASIGYEYTFLPKASSPCRQFGYPDDGIGLFYKRNLFALEQSHTARFALVQELRDLSENTQCTPAYLLLAACHLKAKDTAENEAIRLEQLGSIADTIQTAKANILARMSCEASLQSVAPSGD